ncbi:Predicted metal-binding protein [Mesorhizobium sp. NFR06]|nr:Predicted metal-binding protein [Mesorhizobium sp. NFR06]
MTREPGDLPSETLSIRSPGGFSGQGALVLDSNGSFPSNIADVSSGSDDALAEVTLIVCSSCRDETGSDPHPRAGALLAEDTRRAASGENIRIRTVECLGNCKRRLSAALLRDGCWSYVFGDLDTTSGADLVAGAKLFATSTDGLIPWRGRPDSLKRGLVARIPPLDMLKD